MKNTLNAIYFYTSIINSVAYTKTNFTCPDGNRLFVTLLSFYAFYLWSIQQ